MAPPLPFVRAAGSGPGVVCLHSNASSSSQWRGLMELLAPRFRVLAPDSYGAGKSPDWPSDREISLADEVALIGEIESFYAWHGAVANEREFRILFKTTEARHAAVEAAIRELHDYELPAIHAVLLEQVHAPYGRWIEEGCSP